MRHLALAPLALLLGACGGGSDAPPDGQPPADAREPDAFVKSYCFSDTTLACGYTPEDLTPAEMPLADQAALAHRFNPAMVYTGDDIWAVSVKYMLEQALPGPPRLMRASFTSKLNFSYAVDPASYVDAYSGVIPYPDLTQTDFRTLPLGNGTGTFYAYFLDGPGTNLGNTVEQESWSAAWRGIQGYSDPLTVDPTTAAYPPHQYVHLFWLHKPDHLLALQYWFYYPYDKFTNNHEGDWEHVNVILDMENPDAPVVAFFQFSWHGNQLGVLASDAYRVGDGNGGDHLVNFVGGSACTMFNELWCGDTSGASFPYPGVWDFGQIETLAGDTDNPGRRVHASDFTIDLLARPQDMDFDARPDLSWYQLPFLFGEPITEINDLVVQSTYNNRAPVGPGPDHEEFEIGIEDPDPDILDENTARPFDPPAEWTLINEPPASVFP